MHKFLSIANYILVDGELELVCPVLPSTALGYDLEVMGTNSKRLASIRGHSPADRRVVNDTGYNLLTCAYHLGLPLLREMWFIICSHIHTLDIHSTLKFSFNSTYYQYHYREVSSSLHYSTGQIKKSMQKGSLDESLKSFKN